MALNLTPYFESLGVPQSALRRDERGNVIGVGNMAIVPQQMQPLANSSSIAQAIETLRQALPPPTAGIQATLGAIREAAPQLGEIAQQLPTTLAARNIAATHTGMLPTGRPTEARRHAMAMEAAQHRANALREQQQRFAEAQALANALLGVSAPGQPIALTPEQQEALGPFASILSGAMPLAEAGPPPSLVSLHRNLTREISDINEQLRQLSQDSPQRAELEGRMETLQTQRRLLEARMYPELIDPLEPLRAEVDLMRAEGVPDYQIATTLQQVGYTPEEVQQVGVSVPTIGALDPGATPAVPRPGLIDRLAQRIGPLGIFGR